MVSNTSSVTFTATSCGSKLQLQYVLDSANTSSCLILLPNSGVESSVMFSRATRSWKRPACFKNCIFKNIHRIWYFLINHDSTLFKTLHRSIDPRIIPWNRVLVHSYICSHLRSHLNLRNWATLFQLEWNMVLNHVHLWTPTHSVATLFFWFNIRKYSTFSVT